MNRFMCTHACLYNSIYVYVCECFKDLKGNRLLIVPNDLFFSYYVSEDLNAISK